MDANSKIPASVGILTLNSADRLEGALESVAAFEDRYICDGNSTDDTQELARSAGARIVKQFDTDEPNQRIVNFGEACTKCMNAARHKWFLRLDTDERMSKEAIEEIRKIVSDPAQKIRVWKIPRAYVWRGTVIERAMTYPNNQIRFFHRDAVLRWTKVSHEKTVLKDGELVGTMKGPMLINVTDTYEEFDKKRFARAMNWDKLQYEHKLTLASWLWGVIHTGITMARFGVRLIRVIFAKGTRLPLSYELWRFKYLFATLLLSTKMLVKKIFRS